MEEKSLKWVHARDAQIDTIQASLAKLLDLDIADEIAAHEAKKTIVELNTEYKALGRELRGYTNEQYTITSAIAEINKNLTATNSGVCPTCNQSINDTKHGEIAIKKDRLIFK
jgi:septal ring factor EnvC (AmiA/AmiB activator)